MPDFKAPDFTINRRTLWIIIISAILVVSLAIAIPVLSCSKGKPGDLPNSSSEKPEKVYYDVTLDFGGIKENEKFSVEAGTLLTLTAPDEKYYKFSGWFADAKFKTPFDFEQPVHSDVTVYAKLEDAELDRATYFERFNEDAKNIPANVTNAKTVVVFGSIVVTEVKETEVKVENGAIKFGENTVNLFYTEEYLIKAFFENENYEIISDTYSFRGKRSTSGFTVKYVDKTDGNTYSFLTVLDENHRLSAAQLRLELEAGYVDLYTVYVNKYVY